MPRSASRFGDLDSPTVARSRVRARTCGFAHCCSEFVGVTRLPASSFPLVLYRPGRGKSRGVPLRSKTGFRRCVSAVNRLGGESFYVVNAARQRVALGGWTIPMLPCQSGLMPKRSSRGASGKTGARGKTGATGPAGPPVRREDVVAVVDDQFSDIRKNFARQEKSFATQHQQFGTHLEHITKIQNQLDDIHGLLKQLIQHS